MRRLHLDFIRPPGLGRAQRLALAVVGLLFFVVVLAGLSSLDGDVRRLERLADERQRAQRQDRRPMQPTAAADEATRAALAQANQVMASLNLAWGAMFRQIEQVQVPGVALLAVQREAGLARRLRLTGEARRLDDALTYVSRMAGSPGFAHAHLVSHEVIAADTGRSGVRFALLVDWVVPP